MERDHLGRRPRSALPPSVKPWATYGGPKSRIKVGDGTRPVSASTAGIRTVGPRRAHGSKNVSRVAPSFAEPGTTPSRTPCCPRDRREGYGVPRSSGRARLACGGCLPPHRPGRALQEVRRRSHCLGTKISGFAKSTTLPVGILEWCRGRGSPRQPTITQNEHFLSVIPFGGIFFRRRWRTGSRCAGSPGWSR